MVVEAPFTLGVVGHEGMVTLLPNNTCLHQVIDKHGRILILLKLSLGIIECNLLSLELTFNIIEPGYLGTKYIVLLELGLIGLGDLCLGSSPLGPGLKHVDSSSVEYTRLGRSLECSSNLGVHLYRESAINNQLSIPLLDLLLHPVRESLFENRVDNVSNPLLAHLHDFLAVGQVIVYLRVIVSELCDILESQALVSRDGDVPDVGPVDLLLGSGDLVLEEVDRDLICNIKQKGEQLPY